MNARELVDRSSDLFSLPEVCNRVNELLDEPEVTEEEIANVIGHDPVLTALLLKLANQAPYGSPHQGAQICQAYP